MWGLCRVVVASLHHWHPLLVCRNIWFHGTSRHWPESVWSNSDQDPLSPVGARDVHWRKFTFGSKWTHGGYQRRGYQHWTSWQVSNNTCTRLPPHRTALISVGHTVQSSLKIVFWASAIHIQHANCMANIKKHHYHACSQLSSAHKTWVYRRVSNGCILNRFCEPLVQIIGTGSKSEINSLTLGWAINMSKNLFALCSLSNQFKTWSQNTGSETKCGKFSLFFLVSVLFCLEGMLQLGICRIFWPCLFLWLNVFQICSV